MALRKIWIKSLALKIPTPPTPTFIKEIVHINLGSLVSLIKINSRCVGQVRLMTTGRKASIALGAYFFEAHVLPKAANVQAGKGSSKVVNFSIDSLSSLVDIFGVKAVVMLLLE